MCDLTEAVCARVWARRGPINDARELPSCRVRRPTRVREAWHVSSRDADRESVRVHSMSGRDWFCPRSAHARPVPQGTQRTPGGRGRRDARPCVSPHSTIYLSRIPRPIICGPGFLKSGLSSNNFCRGRDCARVYQLRLLLPLFIYLDRRRRPGPSMVLTPSEM